VKRERLSQLVRLIGIGLGQGGLAVATVLLVRFGFNKLVRGHPDPQMLAWVGGGLAAAAAAAGWLQMVERSESEKLGQDHVTRIRLRLFRRMSILSPRSLQRRSRGAVMLRFVGDLNSLKRWISLGFARLVVSCVTVAAALLVLWSIDPVLALVVVAPLVLGGIAAAREGATVSDTVREARRYTSRLAANVNEKIGAMAVVQAFGQSRRERRRVARQSGRLRDAMVRRAHSVGRLRGIAEFSTRLAAGLTLIVGALEVAAGRTSHGTVVACMTLVHILGTQLRGLGRVHEYWRSAHISQEKIDHFLRSGSLVAEKRGAPPLSIGAGRLEFFQVSVEGAIHHLTACAEPGNVIAVVGRNGAGKSTLLSLAARLMDPDAGRVTIDGQDISQASLASVRRAVGMVSYDLPLLRGTVEQNLRYRWPQAPPQELARVIALCRLDQVIRALPDGLATRVVEGGANLSLGQRQRIALGRALLGRPAILLLDEADANLDEASREITDELLSSHRGVALVATHMRERAFRADFVWRMNRGRLEAVGRPSTILASESASILEPRRVVSLAQ